MILLAPFRAAIAKWIGIMRDPTTFFTPRRPGIRLGLWLDEVHTSKYRGVTVPRAATLVERRDAIERAYAYCVEHDRWPEGFSPFDAIRFLTEDIRAYSRALMAHHEISTLSEAALRESIGQSCQICVLAAGDSPTRPDGDIQEARNARTRTALISPPSDRVASSGSVGVSADEGEKP